MGKRQVKNGNGNDNKAPEFVMMTKEERTLLLAIKSIADLAAKCIDVRLFGAVNAIKGKIMKFTGPVQFNLGKSMHKVRVDELPGTTVFPSKGGLTTGTMTSRFYLSYALIAFHGIVNENAAKDTLLSNEDLDDMYSGMWYGTKNLISQSKVGQMPRFLVVVTYKDKKCHIGELDQFIKIELVEGRVSREEDIRSVEDYTLNITELVKVLADNKDSIESVEFKVDRRLRLSCDFAATTGAKELTIKEAA